MDTGASRDAPPAWTNAGQVSARRAWSRARGTLTAIGVRDQERLCLSAPRQRPGRGAERRLDKANCQLLHPIAVTSRRFDVGPRSLPTPSAPACIHGLQHLMRLNAVEGIITERQQYRAGMLQAVRFRWAAQHFPRRRYLGSAPCRVMVDASGHVRPMTQIRIHDTCCLTLAYFHSGRTPSCVNTRPCAPIGRVTSRKAGASCMRIGQCHRPRNRHWTSGTGSRRMRPCGAAPARSQGIDSAAGQRFTGAPAVSNPSSRSLAAGPYLSRGGQGRPDQCGSNAMLDTSRPSGRAPFP